MIYNKISYCKLIVFVIIFFTCVILRAQNNNIDSLLSLLKTEKTDTGKINIYNKLFLEYEFTDIKKANEFIYKALELSKKTDYKKGLASTYKYLGFFAEDTGNYQQAIIYYKQSLEISDNLSDKKSKAAIIGNIGNGYYFLGDYPKSLSNYFKALKLSEELNDKKGIAKHLGNIGNVYKEQSDYTRALEYYYKALKKAEDIDDKYGIASDLGNIGNAYKEKASIALSIQDYIGSDSLYNKALSYYFNALKYFEELDYTKDVANQLSNIGTVYHDIKDYKKAQQFFFKALKIADELGNKDAIATILGNIGSLYTSIKKYSEAEKYLLQAIAISDSIGTLKDKVQFEISISKLYALIGKDKKALKHYQKAIEAKDSLINEAKSREIMNFEFEKKEAAVKAEQEKKDALASAERRRQQIIMWFFIIGFTLVIFFTYLFYKRWQKTQKQKKIIEKQKIEVESKNKIIEEINKDITDSINSAKLIQNAVLISGNVANNILGEHFILFKPKDIVSGDFYWGTKINEWIIFTVADCTGHGVPGAFMSMLGVSFLNEIVRKKEVTKASEVLDQLRSSIIDVFGKLSEHKEGMDIALCAYNTNNFQLQFAGGNNSLYIVSTQKEIKEIKPDKQPVAFHIEMKPFTNNIVDLKHGDTVYLTSDGFEDQFGGPKNKKFMIKQLKEVLVTISDESMVNQKEILNKTFENWRGENEQIDDVTVMGVKILKNAIRIFN